MNLTNNIGIYQDKDAQQQGEIKLNQVALWESIIQMAKLFYKYSDIINLDLRNTCKLGGQQENLAIEKSSVAYRPMSHSGRSSIVCSATLSTIRKFRTVRIDKLYSKYPCSSAYKPDMVH